MTYPANPMEGFNMAPYGAGAPVQSPTGYMGMGDGTGWGSGMNGLDFSNLNFGPTAGAPGGGFIPTWSQKWLTGYTDPGTQMQTPGVAGTALGAASGLLGGYIGLKQYGLARDSLEQNQEQFDLNYDASKRTTNARLEDRQRARVASNPGAYESVGNYMNKHGVR